MKIGGLLIVSIRAMIFCQMVYKKGNVILNNSEPHILSDLWLLGGIFQVVAKGAHISEQ